MKLFANFIPLLFISCASVIEISTASLADKEKWLEYTEPQLLRYCSKFPAEFKSAAEASPDLLFRAIEMRYERFAIQIVNTRGDLNSRDNDGNTALLLAITCGFRDLALTLLRAGSDPNIGNYDGFTPLMAAAVGDNSESIKAMIYPAERRDNSRQKIYDRMLNDLIKHGANPWQTNRVGGTAMDEALSLRRESAVRLLKRAQEQIGQK